MPIFTVGAAGTTSDSGFNVAGSAMLEANADFYRTPSSEGNRKKFTISIWVKLHRAATATQNIINAQVDGSNYAVLRYENYNFEWIAYAGSQVSYLRTTGLFRDTTAWYHIVIASDTDQGTAANRTKMYINGSQVTDFQTENYPGSAAEYKWNDDVVHSIGAFRYGSTTHNFLHGNVAEVVNIDGQQLDPTSFGEVDSDSGIWKAKKIEGLTFGSQGFYLDFATQVTDPIDASGNGNNFTSSNVIATDYALDVPTNNFCTFMPIHPSAPDFSLAEGNLDVSKAGTFTGGLYGSSIMPTTGKWYWEVKFVVDGGSDRTRAGVAAYESVTGTSTIQGSFSGFEFTCTTGGRFSITENGTTTEIDGFNGYATGDIIRFALDMDNTKLYIGRNGDWFNYSSSATGGDPTSGSGWCTNSAIALAGPVTVYMGHSVGGGGQSSQLKYNFGSPMFSISSGNSDGNGHGNFEYAVPSGYYALNSKNLAEFG